MTIKKVQDQTFEKAGLYSPESVFPHKRPRFKCTFSRVRRFSAIYICFKETYSQKVNGHNMKTTKMDESETIK